MAARSGGGRSRGGRGDDPEFEDYFRRMCKGLRERARTMPRPQPLGAAEMAHREKVRLRALSLLGTMRPELQDLDALTWGEALEKVCDTIIDLWICEDCHEEGTRCSCIAELWESRGEEAFRLGFEDEDDEDGGEEDGEDDRPDFLPPPYRDES